MIAVDTNVLVYAHRRDSEWHPPAEDVLRSLAEGRAPWAIPWPCLHEFLAVATHPAIYDPPTPLERAIDQVDAWLEAPGLVVLAEQGGYWERLRSLVSAGRASGARVHDARVVAICLVHGVRELWTADRDFGRFPDLHTRNPLTEAP